MQSTSRSTLPQETSLHAADTSTPKTTVCYIYNDNQESIRDSVSQTTYATETGDRRISTTLASQMKTFVKSGNSWQAKSGTKDDVIMGQVLMCHLLDELRYHEPDLESYLALNLDEDYDPDDPNDSDNMPFLPIL